MEESSRTSYILEKILKDATNSLDSESEENNQYDFTPNLSLNEFTESESEEKEYFSEKIDVNDDGYESEYDWQSGKFGIYVTSRGFYPYAQNVGDWYYYDDLWVSSADQVAEQRLQDIF